MSGQNDMGEETEGMVFMKLSENQMQHLSFVITPGPILGPDRDNKKDNYSNSVFAYEGNEIRDYLKQFDNVFICNGDRHWQYVTNIPGTTLWEFSCGAGSDSHAGGWQQNDIRPEHRFLRVKGGFLKVSVYRSDNKVNIKFRHCDVDGNVVHEELFFKMIKKIVEK